MLLPQPEQNVDIASSVRLRAWARQILPEHYASGCLQSMRRAAALADNGLALISCDRWIKSR